MLLVLDGDRAETDLLAGRLTCRRCHGRLRPWGWARSRFIREAGGRGWSLRPRRAICSSCKVTTVLLPGSCLPRRRDSARSTLIVLTRAAAGWGARRIGTDMGIPSATVRGFLRHARRHAAKIRMTATVVAHDMDRMLGPITPVPGPSNDTHAQARQSDRRREVKPSSRNASADRPAILKEHDAQQLEAPAGPP